MPRRKRKYERKIAPYRRKKRKRSKKYRRGIPRGLFAKTTKMAFRYVDTITLNPTIGANMVYHTFSANGMYDPDITGTGHQPRGFDQYMQFYQHYTVIGSKLKATFVTNDATYTGLSYVGLTQTGGATPAITDIHTVIEKKSFKVNTVMGTRPRVVTSKCNLSKAFGQKVLQEDANAGTAAANPAEQWYFQVMAGTNKVGVTDPDAMQVLIEIEYIAILHEPKDIGGS